jgi:hypothetical protein
MVEIELMIEDCIKQESKLNEWEQNFIRDIKRKYNSLNITQMQLAKLNEMWDRVT